ncbi:MAG: hypothetical protein WDO73_38150 [Ignavibacteriota bacterium]
MVDDGDALRHTLRLVHVVGSEEDRHAFGLIEMLYMRPELIARLHVEPERRLVEE